jgi:hypothetical protein
MGQDSQNEQDHLTHWEDARDCLINYEKVNILFLNKFFLFFIY